MGEKGYGKGKKREKGWWEGRGLWKEGQEEEEMGRGVVVCSSVLGDVVFGSLEIEIDQCLLCWFILQCTHQMAVIVITLQWT